MHVHQLPSLGLLGGLQETSSMALRSHREDGLWGMRKGLGAKNLSDLPAGLTGLVAEVLLTRIVFTHNRHREGTLLELL